MVKKRQYANQIPVNRQMNILVSMVGRNIKVQYRRSILGILWTVLNPLLTVVFTNIFGRSNSDLAYPLYILSGNITFNLMRSSTVGSLGSLVNNYDLMTKTRVPAYIFPTSQVLSNVVTFGFSLIAYIIVMVVLIAIKYSYGVVAFFWTDLMILFPLLPALILFSMGISYVLSIVYIRFRDVKHLYEVFLTLWFYLTPIFYSPDKIGEKMAMVLKFNPMYHFVNYFRQCALGIVPSWKTHLVIYGCGIGMFLIGLLIFKLCHKKAVLYI